MTETTLDTPASEEKPRRLRFDWLLGVIIKPRATFEQIVHEAGSVWLTPLLGLMVMALVRVFVAGGIRMAMGGMAELPPDYQYWSPDQQSQYMQTAAMMSGPIFVFVFPAITAVLSLWVGWLIVGGLLNLSLALFGGRSSSGSIMNLAAWALLPFGVRDLIQVIYMIFTNQPVSGAGLSGFAPLDAGQLTIIMVVVLGLIDLYLIWHAVLLKVGVSASGGLSQGRAWASVLAVVFASLIGQAVLGFIGAQLSNLTVGGFFF